jgi:hypothetical protein
MGRATPLVHNPAEHNPCGVSKSRRRTRTSPEKEARAATQLANKTLKASQHAQKEDEQLIVAFERRRIDGSIYSRSWMSATTLRDKWLAYCAELLPNMKCCAYCGRGAYGGKHSMHARQFTVTPAPAHPLEPPAALCNPYITPYVFAPTSTDSSPLWNVCAICKTPASRAKR